MQTWNDAVERIVQETDDLETARARNPALGRAILSKTPQVAVRVPMDAAGPLGLVPGARVLELAAHAWIEAWLRYGIDLPRRARRGTAFLVRGQQLALLTPIRGRDELRVHCRLLALDEATLDLEQAIFDGKGRRAKAIVSTHAQWTELSTGAPAAIPDDLRKILAQVAMGEPSRGAQILAHARSAVDFWKGRRS